jgi:WXG100 family type VII secretion target
MATLIKAIPEELLQHANKLDGQIERYVNIVRTVYTQRDNLNALAAGEAHTNFSQRLEGFRDDLNSMQTLLMKYSEYIKTAANLYLQTEQALAKDARTKLVVDI